MARDLFDDMKAPELREHLRTQQQWIANFVQNYNQNVDVMEKMEETIIDLDAENERLQMKQEALITTIAILSEGAA